jgi:hypothetical protein
MGRLVAAGAICEQEAAVELIEQGQRIGLGATECERTVASGMTAGMEQPRGPQYRLGLDLLELAPPISLAALATADRA